MQAGSDYDNGLNERAHGKARNARNWNIAAIVFGIVTIVAVVVIAVVITIVAPETVNQLRGTNGFVIRS